MKLPENYTTPFAHPSANQSVSVGLVNQWRDADQLVTFDTDLDDDAEFRPGDHVEGEDVAGRRRRGRVLQVLQKQGQVVLLRVLDQQLGRVVVLRRSTVNRCEPPAC